MTPIIEGQIWKDIRDSRGRAAPTLMRVEKVSRNLVTLRIIVSARRSRIDAVVFLFREAFERPTHYCRGEADLARAAVNE